MFNASRIVKTTLAAAGFCAALGAPVASAQGFFESLFGGWQPREGRSAYQQDSGRAPSYSGYGYGRSQAGYDNGTLDPADPRLHREIRRRAQTPRRPGGTLARAVESSPGAAGMSSIVQATADAPRGSIAYFAKDKTLRAGDVVVTEKGFLVYQGGRENSRNAFMAIDQSGSMKGDRKGLLALQEVSTMRTPNITIETISAERDFIGPRTPEQMALQEAVKKLSRTAAR